MIVLYYFSYVQQLVKSFEAVETKLPEMEEEKWLKTGRAWWSHSSCNDMRWLWGGRCVFSPSICHSFRCQSMMRPPPDIFEASSIQSCDERIRAFTNHSDKGPTHKIWVGLTCRNSVLHACKWWQLSKKQKQKKRGQSKLFNQLTPHFSCETVVLGSFVLTAWNDFSSCST